MSKIKLEEVVSNWKFKNFINFSIEGKFLNSEHKPTSQNYPKYINSHKISTLKPELLTIGNLPDFTDRLNNEKFK